MGILNLVTVLAILPFLIFESTLAKDKEWWETTTIYQIYPRSFKDSDGDGVGDLNGIYEKLDYIQDIGIETIWIQPFYKSPMADFGYDVSDFTEIEPMFGTMDDFKRLIAGIHKRGMKLVMDLVPNHVSDESDWFKKSIDQIDPYTDFFIWHSGGYNETTKQRIVPNNWLSIFGGSAWEWNDKRKQFYFKQFAKRQPDLNFRHQAVRDAMKDVIRFWLDLGVDGFRIDAIKHLMEVADLRDEPYISPTADRNNYASQLHIYTTDLDDTYEVTHEWRLMMDEYEKKDGKARIMCAEAYTGLDKLMQYFGNKTYANVHFPFYFGFVSVDQHTNAKIMNTMVHEFIDEMPSHGVANWVVSNHDNPRLASRTSPAFSDAMNMIELLLPGVASVYYGDEIGIEDAVVRNDQTKDPNNGGGGRTDTRDPERAPMQWDDSMNAGFTSAKVPWLPLNSDYWYKNVKKQLEEPISHLNVFKRLMDLRKTEVIKYGNLETCVLSDWVFLYSRNLESEPSVVVVVNLGSESETVCVKNCIKNLPDLMEVHTSSVNSGYNPGERFIITNTAKSLCSVLRPKAGLVLTTPTTPTHSSSASHAKSFLCLSFSLILALVVSLFRSDF